MGFGDFLKSLFNKDGYKYYKADAAKVRDNNAASFVMEAKDGGFNALDFSGSRKLGGKGVSKLSSWKELKALNLSKCDLSDADLEGLKGLNQLEHLDLSGNPIQGSCFLKIGGLPNLVSLDLSGTNLVDKGLVALRQGNFNKIQVLNMAGSKITEVGVSHIDGFKELQEVDLSRCPVDDSVLATFTDKTISIKWDK